jgi:proline-specific peptidase
MKGIFKILAIIFVFQSCQEKDLNRETILDNISHVEDSIYYNMDTLPRLCDVLGMEKQYIDIGDCKLYYEVEGEGTPIVLINGGPGGTHHYFHPSFAKAKEYCKVIYYDQRGCGQSDFIKGEGYTFKQAIDDLDKLRQKLGIDRWIVCGYSYGGALAQYYTTSYPDHVLGMVLIGSVPLLQDDLLSGTRQYDYISKEEQQKIDEIYKLYRSKKINLQQLLFNKELNGDWKRQNFIKPEKEEMIRLALYEWVNDKGFNSTMSGSYSRYNFKDVFNKCPIPTLLCEGKWDLTWKEDKPLLMKRNHPNAQYVMFENSGHSIYYDEPELFFSTLKKFAASLKPISSSTLHNWQIQSSAILEPQERLFENEAHFFSIIENDGIQKALDYYAKFKLNNEKNILFSEQGMNSLGYSYLRKKDYETAIELFKMNVEFFPDSWNVYDSLGEAYLANGNKEKAKENYIKSIELNPDSENGKKILKEIQA